MTAPKDLALDISGILQVKDPENPAVTLKIVYQGTSHQFANYYTKLGKPKMIRAYVQVVNPKTPAQLARQEAMRQAVQNWQEATNEQRETARSLANSRQITLYMAFISLQLKALNPILATIWDAGATSWDSATTIWDI